MRKKRQPEHENHERWLVSYADFITLLFAFFVVMFASTQTDKSKAAQIQESVKRAIEDDSFMQQVASVLGGTPDDAGLGSNQMRGPGGQQNLADTLPDAVPALVPAMQKLQAELDQEIAAGQMSVKMDARGLVVSFQQAAFFPSGTDEIPVEAWEQVAKVADVILSLPNRIRLEGHTDSQPVRGGSGRFVSNWELSAARAISMMEMLVECCDVPRTRLSVAGYADTAPVAANDSFEGRTRNRRVDIVILNEAGSAAEPSLNLFTDPEK
jgi:chemotaxis protein MotB